MALTVQKNVFQFDISVHNPKLNQNSENFTFTDLLEICGERFHLVHKDKEDLLTSKLFAFYNMTQ